MSGYCGYSMSNNAVEAYDNGEKPKSKWTKQDFIDYAEENCPEVIEKIKKVTLKDLRAFALTQSSWHHTSKFYNETNFYTINEDFFKELQHNDFSSKSKETKQLLLKYSVYLDDKIKLANSIIPPKGEISVYEYVNGEVELYYGCLIKSGKLSDIEKHFIYLPGIENSSAGIASKRGQAKLQLQQKTKAHKPGQGLEKRETQNTKGIIL